VEAAAVFLEPQRGLILDVQAFFKKRRKKFAEPGLKFSFVNLC
jgi:hypothetical protein